MSDLTAPDFSRKAIRGIEKFAKTIRQGSKEDSNTVLSFISKIRQAQKFALPDEGKILDDKLKGLPKIIKLPFPIITLEYARDDDEVIVIAEQISDKKITATMFLYKKDNSAEWRWNACKSIITLVEDGDEDNENTIVIGDAKFTIENQIASSYLRVLKKAHGITLDHEVIQQIQESSFVVICPILELLEALSCSNIDYVKIPKTKADNKIATGSLKYDSYYVLTVKACKTPGLYPKDLEDEPNSFYTKRREHLRRGHIRQYRSGLRIWVQSCVVNAGIGGKIHKDYVVTA